MDNIEYGQWVTYNGERRMILGWNDSQTMLRIYMGKDASHPSQWVPVEETTERSDFMITDAQRKLAGYAF